MPKKISLSKVVFYFHLYILHRRLQALVNKKNILRSLLDETQDLFFIFYTLVFPNIYEAICAEDLFDVS